VSLTKVDVHNLLAKKFLCAWRSSEGDPEAGSSNRHACGTLAQDLHRGSGKANVQTLVLTPEGHIFYAMSGYVGPNDLLRELAEALKTWEQIQADPRHADVTVRRRMREIVAENGEDATPTPTPRGGWHRPIVARDRTFVVTNALMPLAEFRTRMLTGGDTQTFGYGTSSAWDREHAPEGLTRHEFLRLPSVLRKAVATEAPRAFRDSPAMIPLSQLSESLRKRLDRRLRIMRKSRTKAAQRD
jgi:hypothetical protein